MWGCTGEWTQALITDGGESPNPKNPEPGNREMGSRIVKLEGLDNQAFPAKPPKVYTQGLSISLSQNADSSQ